MENQHKIGQVVCPVCSPDISMNIVMGTALQQGLHHCFRCGTLVFTPNGNVIIPELAKHKYIDGNPDHALTKLFTQAKQNSDNGLIGDGKDDVPAPVYPRLIGPDPQ